MSDLRKAAQQALAAMDYMLNNGEWYQAQDRADALRAALAQPEPEPVTQEIERLRAALRYEENRFSRIGTHGPDCWKWGPSHYECALQRITNA